MKDIDSNDMLSLWAAFLNDPNNEKLIELESKYEELHEAKIELARLSRDPKEVEIYRMREDAMDNKRNFFLETLEQGREQGLKEGEKRKSIEIAKSLIGILIGILDVETIATKTGLSVDDVEKLK